MGQYVYFGMSEQDYLNLANWIQDWRKWSEHMSELVRFYRRPDPE